LTRKATAIVLVTAMLTAVFSLCISFYSQSRNPFLYFDTLREESINKAGGKLFNEQTDNNTDNTSGENGYIVKFKGTVSLQDIHACVSRYDFRLLAHSKQRIFRLTVNDLAAFRNDYGYMVEDIEAERALTLSAAVNDPLADDQWELDSLQMYRAWNITTGNSNVTVAVLDSGVYRQHPDFEGVSILAGYDAVNRTNVVNVDHNGHGTKVISIIAAAANNGQGMAGVGRNISVMPIRVSDNTGYIHSADFIEAVYYAADSGVDIINMSFGGYTYSAMEEAATEYASSKGCILIASAGNNENETEYAGAKAYPASYSTVISVGAIDKSGALCSFSQRNDSVDLVAPGDDITVATMAGGYQKEYGTSFSTAYVSAVAALALSAIDDGVRFTADQFVALVSVLNGNKKDNGYGYGAIDAYEILTNINMPLVSGVINGGVYHKNTTITFNRGTAILDGKPFFSGNAVIISGSHTLTVTDKGKNHTVSFITDNIPLKYSYRVNANNAAISFERGTATLDGMPYISGTPITASGRHYFRLVGPYGNTESYEFECKFEAPLVFGVENGGRYTTPVCITAEKGGLLTLNGNTISSGTVVSKNGIYTLISATSDGKKRNVIYFTVSAKNVSVSNAAVANSKLIADEKHQSLILYNNALPGIRVCTWQNTTRAKSFIRTKSGVTGYAFHNDLLVLLQHTGVSVCNRANLAAGNTSGVTDHSFGNTATASAFKDGLVYYTVATGSGTALYTLDITSSYKNLVANINTSVTYLFADGDKIVAANQNGELLLYNTKGELVTHTSTNARIDSMTASGGYICTNSFVYERDTLKKLFALRSNERVVFEKNGILVTDRSVYDIKSHAPIAFFGDTFIDSVITENGYVFKSLTNSTIESVKNNGIGFDASNAAKILNAAPNPGLTLGPLTQLSSYESFSVIPDGAGITGAVPDNSEKYIFAISSAHNALFTIDCNTLAVVSQTHLSYEPSSICTDGNNCYVSFRNESVIYKHSVAKNSGVYYSCAAPYIKTVYGNGKLYCLTGDGNLYAISADSPDKGAETVIKGQNVISYTYSNGFIYAYLKPVTASVLYKINTADYTVAKATAVTTGENAVFVANNILFLGNKAYSATGLEPIYTTNGAVKYAYGDYFITEDGLHLAASGTIIGNCRVDTTLPMFGKTYNYYNIENGRITRILNIRADLESLPKIEGITAGEVINGTATPTHSFGIAFLDGEAYTTGTPIENGGLHTFTVALPFGVTATVQFTINARINSITITATKTGITVNETALLTVTARPLTYGVVDVTYTTDNNNVVVLPDGGIIGVTPGDCRITATTADGLHSASINIKVTKGYIAFDSSYFRADNNARIVKGIAAGTDVEAFLVAASQTKGVISVRGYNGVEVTAGMIHTGMTAELYDLYGNIIDTWHLSVLGDVDGDGYLTANDYYVLEKMLTRPDSFTPALMAAADIDGNNKANSFDLLSLKEHLLKQRLINGEDVASNRVSNTTAHIIMPKSLTPSTSFTASITFTDMKNVTAVSGLLKYNSAFVTLDKVTVLGDGGGFYTETPEGVYFFTNTRATTETSVVLLAVFSLSQFANEESDLAVSCTDLRVYDGSAATTAEKTFAPAFSNQATPQVLIYNLPDYNFDNLLTENRLTFDADTRQIHAAVYPMNAGEVVGNTEFGNRLNAAFSAVLTAADGTITQYNYECEKKEGPSSSTTNSLVYKNNNTYIASVTVSGGVLSPSFDKDITEYYVVTADPASVFVTAQPESVLSTATVSEYDAEKGTVTISCTAEDGSVTYYTLHLCKELPLSYPTPKADYGFLWFIIIPAILIGGGITAYMLYRKKTKEVS